MVKKTDEAAPAAEETTALTVAGVGGSQVAIVDDLFDDDGNDRDATNADQMSIPFLSILQPTSPQVTEGGSEFIEDARPGMIYNSVTKQVIDSKKVDLIVINASFRDSYVEWITRENGGGFVAEYPVAEGVTAKTVRNDKNQDIIQAGSPVGTPGNQLTYTHTHYVMIVDKDSGSTMPAVIAAAITQVKPSKDWNTLINNLAYKGRPLARVAGIWKITTALKERDGNRWYIWNFSKFGDTGVVDLEVEGGNLIRGRAKTFREGIVSGAVSADMANPSASEFAGGGDGADDGGVIVDNADIPF